MTKELDNLPSGENDSIQGEFLGRGPSDEYLRGYRDGVKDGAAETLRQLRPLLEETVRNTILGYPLISKALSDGLRKGSSDAARAMSLYRH